MIDGKHSVLRLDSVSRVFGDVAAVNGVSLQIRAGEFFGIIGPSGCGKSTLLKMMAGIDSPTTGEIDYQEKPIVVSKLRFPEIVLVWQSLALFPHMNVAKNVEFGLRVRGVTVNDRKARVAAALSMVGLEDFRERRIDELSGGEQQRVALARALILRPRVLLLDEPFGSLDPHRRGELQVALTKLHRETGITFVMVTHDQSEALTLASRIAVMNAGHFDQIGTPEAILASPTTAFVARFVGNKNVYAGVIENIVNNTYTVRTRVGVFLAVARPETPLQLAQGSKVVYIIPADQIVEGAIHVNATKGMFLGRVMLGSSQIIRLAVADDCILSYERCRNGHGTNGPTPEMSDRTVSWPDTAAYLLAG
ncbi:MAG: spermidine/putrescine transport system ATP-binding protein [Verrucomicrobiota bacterium]|jgi:ABC-type Fe3+/spermidine/putrescine transport system ATPase subunit